MKQVVFHDDASGAEYVVETDSHLTIFDIAIGQDHRTSKITVILNGIGAEVNLYGLFFGVDEETFDLAHEVIHQAPQTKSRLTTRGALGGRAKASYNGNIRILKDIPGCDGRQETRTLLLSRAAHIDAVPHLEIGNNDVACAHSVSVSYINEVKKFYCESRGLSAAEAVRAIVQGHFAEIVDRIPEERLKIEIENKIEEKL